MRVRNLTATSHTVLRLTPGLLLVFKPAGHREAPHSHPYRQALQVLSGLLAVDRRGRRLLRPGQPRLSLPAGTEHATEALEDTWLLAIRDEGRSSTVATPVRRRTR